MLSLHPAAVVSVISQPEKATDRGPRWPMPKDENRIDSRGRTEIDLHSAGVARIRGVMGTLDASISIPSHTSTRTPRRKDRVTAPPFRGLRAPWRRGPWSPHEVALALHSKREELRREFARRSEARGIGTAVHGEIVDEAICAVVMMGREVVSEEHLVGAFWTAAHLVVRHHHEGRGRVRLGTRQRVDFDSASEGLASGPEPGEIVEVRDRMARAADFIASLDELEQRVIVAMAVHGDGFKLAARRLSLPVGTVRAAIRSGEAKLDRVAAIAAAGRMCSYRAPAIRAHASGTAGQHDERLARAHIAACAGCRDAYVSLAREMQAPQFRRQAAAAFLPVPMLALHVHGRWIERLSTLLPQGRTPSGTAAAERTAGLLGTGGLAKAAAAGTAVVIAGAGVSARVIHSLETPSPRTPRRAQHTVAKGQVRVAPIVREASSRLPRALNPRPSGSPRARAAARVPSRGLGYLALGGSAGGSTSVSKASLATAASTSSTGPSDEASVPVRSGGGASLNYLGH